MRNSARVVSYCIRLYFWLEEKIPQPHKTQMHEKFKFAELGFSSESRALLAFAKTNTETIVITFSVVEQYFKYTM